MSDNVGATRLGWLVGLAALVLVAALAYVLIAPTPESETPPVAAAPSAPAAPATPPSTAPAAAPVTGSVMKDYLKPPTVDVAQGEDGPAKPYPIDLEKLRAKLPDNLYWSLAAPTTDAEVLKKREDDTRRWNDAFGRIQSGEATEQEVRDYYAHRRKVSEDMVQFATTVMADHGGELPERDRGLYELSINMHRTRLSEYPRQEEEAQARRREREALRTQWREGQPSPP
ncbi:hypothetical protein LZ198_08270 [Myxococcus sp. K15C18031901]|uniref:hypothetical protein n=1 Tax=Myxococcus dinghuensis TaxID=2906761 RepID=UPI0020A73296|nr:hypothetical protein [Myxococcus dinghuensis]MCP3098868.1 hypothetical protein [Myxococcus dinghuensis]